jgi:hypothetical protein
MRATGRDIQEDGRTRNYRCENRKPHFMKFKNKIRRTEGIQKQITNKRLVIGESAERSNIFFVATRKLHQGSDDVSSRTGVPADNFPADCLRLRDISGR